MEGGASFEACRKFPFARVCYYCCVSCGEIQLFPLGGGNEEEEIVVAELKSRELDMVMPRKTN